VKSPIVHPVGSQAINPRLAKALHQWYDVHHRPLPWRETRNPYAIWLSEVILQQTRVEQGKAYYLRFLEAFPTVGQLARAPLEEVLKCWQGLGYYSRARNLHKAAMIIAARPKGIFPSNYEEIRALPGVGDYTAAAIASFCFDLPYAVLDGNVMRVLARLTAFDGDVGKPANRKHLQALASQWLPIEEAAIHNQSIMELGAMVCIPRNPQCPTCPLLSDCRAAQLGIAEQLPVKSSKAERKKRFLNYVVIEAKGKIAVQQREEGDIWAGLFEFPLIEASKPLSWKDVQIKLNSNKSLSGALELEWQHDAAKHLLSHQELHARFFHVKANTLSGWPASWRWVKSTEFHQLPIPRLLHRHLHHHKMLV